MAVVFDASALIAYARNEAGAEHVERLLLDDAQACYVHAVNICELYYDFLRTASEEDASAVLAGLDNNGLIIREDMDIEFWMSIARLKARHRISIADACGLTLAHRLRTEFVTTDHHELDLLLGSGICEIRFIR